MSIYTLAGDKFTQKQLVFGQIVWIRDMLCGKKCNSMTPNEYADVIVKSLPRFLSIVLLRDGQSQPDKVTAGQDGVTALETWINGNVPSSELFSVGMAVMNDFFDFNPGETGILIDGEIRIPVKESVSTG